MRRICDVFCGEGGAAAGWVLAGFAVYGIDDAPARLSRYPYARHEGDAIEALSALLRGEALDFTHPDGTVEWLRLEDFDAFHGSPPCTGYTRGTAAVPDRLTRYDRLIGATRELFEMTGLPYVIENVPDARPEMRDPIKLCWSMFNAPGSVIDDDGTPLRMERHRLFESNFPIEVPFRCSHPKGVQVAGAYSGARRDKVEARVIRKGGYVPPSLRVLRLLVGCGWMSETGCFLSIPPAYTRLIGRSLLDHLARSE